MRRLLSSISIASLGAFSALATGGAGAAAVVGGAVAQPTRITILDTHALTAPLSTSDCQAELGIACYSPTQYRVAYDLNTLYANNVTGQGRTIVLVDSFGSPTIANDLHVFDTQFGFPDPSLTVIQFGTIPTYDPTNSSMVGWAEETTLDVEYAHSIAPGAKIVLAETAVAETEGTTGFPEIMQAEDFLIKHNIGDVISQSFGATENTFPGFDVGDFSSIMQLRYAFIDARAHNVTVLASSGDDGATNAESDGSTLYSTPVNAWPSSDPLVTSVGGTQLNLDDSGARLSPDVVWNDGFGAGGGGGSQVFTRPAFQNGVTSAVGDARGTPDISMSAAVNGGCWVYMSFGGISAGWHIVGGTSEASPIFAGIVALADQRAGRRLGDINPALYKMGGASLRTTLPTGLVDVTSGNNSFAGVTGYTAGTGYDVASGWGTIDATVFVRQLRNYS